MAPRLPRFQPQNVSDRSLDRRRHRRMASACPAPCGAAGRLDEDDVGTEAGEDERGAVALAHP